MRIYYDWEFVEDGSTIDPLSVGMVAEDGRELYLVLDDDVTVTRAVRQEWLRDNVVKHLPVRLLAEDVGEWAWDDTHEHWPLVVNHLQATRWVREFIEATPDPELWAYFGAYDHVAYAQLFGAMIDLPDGFPMWTNDLKQELHRAGNPTLPPTSSEHHALADAHWVMATHQWLEEVQGGPQRALMLRLETQKTAIIAAREILRMINGDNKGDVAQNVAIERWMTQFSTLADPPAVVEVEEDDDEDDDVPHDSPEAGKSSGRWRPLEPAGAAHLDFAEDTARRARGADDG